ncbi:MAG TPA: family 43 glycosylhydrolase [Bacilli bacterium]|nr:family 43 glycosylhydrolase [Bacilli bacterium]
MTYKNPLTATHRQTDHYGDPFVFRYQGKYYLFVSTPDGATNIRVFISDDLINFSYLGDAVDEPLLEAAYAPEIIYAYNKFYMVTSPKGNGHYIYVSDQPEGPYRRLTDNVNSMIDGSFFVGPDGMLHLLRADHAGIALLDVSPEGKLSNRRNLGAYLNAWTEGPHLFYRDGYYYLTYCGNHLLSKGYRIAYATSKRFDGDFEEGINNPLLINTNEGYTRLGHSSSVLAPDLDGHYIVYHTMEQGDNGFLPRKFMIDRLRFSGRLMHASSSNFEIISPLRPKYETFDPVKDMIRCGLMLLSKAKTSNRYTLEASFKGSTALVVGYQSSDHYIEIKSEDKQLVLIRHEDGLKTIEKFVCPFDFSHFHTIRLINDEHCEILIDNAIIAITSSLQAGQIGYLGAGTYAYTAFNDHANGSSDCHYPSVLPGIIDISHRCANSGVQLDRVDGIPFIGMKEERYEYVTSNGGTYALFAYAHVSEASTITVNDQVIDVYPTPSEYKYLSYFIGYVDLEKLGTVKLSLIKGSIDYKFLTLDKAPRYSTKIGFIEHDGTLVPHQNKDSFLLEKDISDSFDVSCEFTISALRPYDVFGMLLATRQYSNEYPQARLPLVGYLVGFEGGLLIIDRLNYGRHRVYDRPTSIKENVSYNLRVTFSNGRFEVFLDGQSLITTTVSQPAYLGGHGLYASLGSSVSLSHLTLHKERR